MSNFLNDIFKKPSLLLASLALCMNMASYSQDKVIKPSLSGIVVDEYGNPLAGVIIKVEGEFNGAVTDPDGSFDLYGIVAEGSTLSFDFLGYSSQTVVKKEGDYMKVKMTPDVSFADQEIMVVKDKRSKLSLTQAVATVTGEELCKTHHNNLGAALAGRLPGLIVQADNNEPGSEGYTLMVRGTSTTTGRSPLILIDGMRVSGFSHLNPEDVAYVSVFKDAAANALYGMQGGNGVISITTKRGEISKSRLSLNASYGVQQAVKTPEMLDSWLYAALENEAYKNDGYGDYYAYSLNDIFAYKDGTNRALYPNNNWYDMFMKSVVQTQDINLSASGGSKFFKYYTSLGYMHQDSPFETDGTNPEDFGLHRFHVRSNVDVRVNDFITGFMNIAARIERNTITNAAGGTAGILNSMFEMPSTVYGPLTPEGQVVVTPQYTSPTYAQINRSGYRRQTNTYITANIGLNFDLDFLLKGLSASGEAKFYTNSLSNIHGNTDYERWTRDLTKPDELVFNRYGTSEYKPITLSKGNMYSYTSEFDGNLNYKGKFGRHSVSGLVNLNYQYDNPAATVYQPYKRLTVGMRASYSYNDMLFIDAITSIQGSEQFKDGKRYGAFPALSAGWVISNMSWFEPVKDIFSQLKLRASYGMVGNDQMTSDRFLFREQLTEGSGGLIESLEGVINYSRIANPDITWEKGKIADIGIDMSLYNQLYIGLDLFREDRTDVLVPSYTVPSSLGLPGDVLPFLNNGHIVNQGFDLYAGYTKQFTKDFSVNINGNFSYNKNEIKNIGELYLGDDYAYSYRQTGFSVFEQWGYLIDYSNGNGYFNSDDELISSGLTYEGVPPRKGDFIYKDLNGDQKIDEKDMAPMGKTSIPAYAWGATLGLKWKNFDLSVMFQGLGDFGTFNSGLGFYETANNGTYFKQHVSAWSEARYKDGKIITAPALSKSETASHKPNNYYFQDKSFARLKNVEIGYTLPQSVAKKIYCRNVRIYASGINLLTFDKMKSDDLDVEMSSMNAFPTYRYVNVGLNIMF